MFGKRAFTATHSTSEIRPTDKAAFSALYRSHVDRVYRYCLFRTGNVQDAQDITSQVFMAAWEQAPTYSGKGSMDAWLIGIARHKTADHFRRVRAMTPLESMSDLPDGGVAVAETIEMRLSAEQVMQQAQTLAPDRAEVFALRFLAELSNGDIARVTGRSETAVRMLVHRALSDLRQRLASLWEDEIEGERHG
ncbi:MAG: sigma-70 family RNA polymerase sigma factor [Caldilineaceae bacterium]